MGVFDPPQDVLVGKDTTGHVVGFSILCILSACFMFYAIFAFRQSHYRSIMSLKILFPFAVMVLTLENGSLAAVYNGNKLSDFWEICLQAAQATIVPILLVSIFELTYCVHKARSVNFCGMFFDEGRRVGAPRTSFVLRNFIRLLAVLTLALGIGINFDQFEESDPLAGRTGWYTFIKDDRPFDEKHTLFYSLLINAILVVSCFYLSLVLWRYGTEASMVVHSSLCNPWFGPFFGTLALAGGQCFGEEWFMLLSNAGTLTLIFTLLLLMNEVDKDMEETGDIEEFLECVAEKANEMHLPDENASYASREKETNNVEIT